MALPDGISPLPVAPGEFYSPIQRRKSRRRSWFDTPENKMENVAFAVQPDSPPQGVYFYRLSY